MSNLPATEACCCFESVVPTPAVIRTEDHHIPSKVEVERERDMCTPMFIAALFIIARTWKQPRCPSADE